MLFFDRSAADRLLAEIKRYLSTLVDELRERGIAARYVVANGPVVKSILDVAERENADLIAMASHGRTGLARVFYGSIAAGVMQQADRPLLLVRSGGINH
jgi:nucleotide-binding universal stress UspA family protein